MASSNPLPLSFFQPPDCSIIASSSSSGINMTANSDTKEKRRTPSKGRRKIPIKKIEDKSKKHVTFSKRRKGLFSKSRELCVLCGASVAVVTFSEAGKAFSFGHPSTDDVIDRYLNGGSGASSSSNQEPVSAGNWWDRPVEELAALGDLERFAASLEKMKSNVDRRIGDLYELDQTEVKTEIVCREEDMMMMIQQHNNNYWSFNGSAQLEYVQQSGCVGVGDADIATIVAMAQGN